MRGAPAHAFDLRGLLAIVRYFDSDIELPRDAAAASALGEELESAPPIRGELVSSNWRQRDDSIAGNGKLRNPVTR